MGPVELACRLSLASSASSRLQSRFDRLTVSSSLAEAYRLLPLLCATVAKLALALRRARPAAGTGGADQVSLSPQFRKRPGVDASGSECFDAGLRCLTCSPAPRSSRSRPQVDFRRQPPWAVIHHRAPVMIIGMGCRGGVSASMTAWRIPASSDLGTPRRLYVSHFRHSLLPPLGFAVCRRLRRDRQLPRPGDDRRRLAQLLGGLRISTGWDGWRG